VRIGFLELVGGAMDEELGELLAGPASLEMLRQRWPVVLLDQPAQGDVHRACVRGRRGPPREGGIEPRLEDRLEAGAELERPEVPLPPGVDTVKAAVVELVEDVQAQVQIVVGQRLIAARDGAGVEAPGRPAERIDHAL
jgi:hypothetical protein